MWRSWAFPVGFQGFFEFWDINARFVFVVLEKASNKVITSHP
jgi:hypothetical protein